MFGWSRKSDGMPPPCITSKVPHSASAAQNTNIFTATSALASQAFLAVFPSQCFPIGSAKCARIQ
jgi:hypothetical protein